MSPFSHLYLACSLSPLRNLQLSTIVMFVYPPCDLSELNPQVPGDSTEKLSEQNASPMA